MSVFDRPAMYRIELEELRRMYERQNFTALEENLTFPMRRRDGRSYHGLLAGNHGEDYHPPAETRALLEEADDVSNFWNHYFTHYARRAGKKRWAEKTPNNIFCADQFLEFYPRGRFVHLIRNGRDVCLSLLDRRDANPLHSCMRWIVSLEAAAELSEHDRFYELRYENLVREPEETLGVLFEWLNSEFDPRVLGFHENADGGVLGYGTTPVHTDSIGRWERQREKLPPTIRELVELGTRRHLRALGYEPIEDR